MSMDDSIQRFMDSIAARGLKKCPRCGIEMRLHSIRQAEDCFNETYIEKDIHSFWQYSYSNHAWSPAMRLFTDNMDTNCTEAVPGWVNWQKQPIAIWNPKAVGLNSDSWISALELSTSDDWAGAYFYGPPGTGKTHAARLCLLQYSLKFKQTAEITAYRMMANAQDWDHKSLFYMYSTVEVLLIDDIDKCIWNERNTMALWDIINRRSELGAKTILTGNVVPNDLRGIFNSGSNASVVESMMQRLHPITVLKFDGESVRDWILKDD